MMEELLKNNALCNVEKFSARAISAENPIIKERMKRLSNMEYSILKHVEDGLDNESLITIILTIYNSNIDFIKKSIATIIDQSYNNVEFIIVSNGTTGETFSYIKEIFLKNKHTTLLHFTEHHYNPMATLLDDPIPNLWNAALFCSKGEYVYFLSYDDYLSENYAEKMVCLFKENANCLSAAPLVVSIDENGQIINEPTNLYLRRNIRGRYTPGLSLAENYIDGGDMVLFPGGLFAHRSDNVLRYGGFDNINDISQLVKLAIQGDSGFDPDATLYWRHHASQANRIQKEMGLIYYKNFAAFSDLFAMKSVLKDAGAAPGFIQKYYQFMDRLAAEGTYGSLKDSLFMYGYASGTKALYNLFKALPKTKYVTACKIAANIFCKKIYSDSKKIIPEVFKPPLRQVKKGLKFLLAKKSQNFFEDASFNQQLLHYMRNNRYHYTTLSSQGCDFSFLEYGHSAHPPSAKLFDIANKATSLLSKNSERDRELYQGIPHLFDYNNHYMLIKALAEGVNAKSVIELGTASGSSLWAWLQSEHIEKIATWDILPLDKNQDWFTSEAHKRLVLDTLAQDSRWQQYVEDVAQYDVWEKRKELWACADVIFIDGPHDGIFEKMLILRMLQLDNKKDIILLFDDILVSSMKDFFAWLPLEKLDISCIGHQSGTGIAILPPRSQRLLP